MSSPFYFFKLSQGNKDDFGLISADELAQVRSAVMDASDVSPEDRFWMYYGRLVSDPIASNAIDKGQYAVWLNLGKKQKALVAMNVLIDRGNNGGTFSVMENSAEYYFVVLEALRYFHIVRSRYQRLLSTFFAKDPLDDLAARYGLVKTYVDKHFGTIDQLEEIWKSSPEVYQSKFDAFMEIYDEKILDFDTTDLLFWDDDFQNRMYTRLVEWIEGSI